MSRDPKVLTSVSVTSRVEVVELLAALRVLQGFGAVPRTRSELVSLCVRVVAEMMSQDGWPNFVDALYELDSRYPVKTRRGTNLITKQSSEKRAEYLRKAEYEYNMRLGFSRGENFLQTPGGQTHLQEEASRKSNSEALTNAVAYRAQNSFGSTNSGQLSSKEGKVDKYEWEVKELEKDGKTYIVCADRAVYNREKARWEGHPDLASGKVKIVTQNEWDGIPEKPRYVIPPELLAKVEEDTRRIREAEADQVSQPEEAHK